MASLNEQQQMLTIMVIYLLANSLNALINIQFITLPSLFRTLRQQQEIVNSAIAERNLRLTEYHLIT